MFIKRNFDKTEQQQYDNLIIVYGKRLVPVYGWAGYDNVVIGWKKI